MKDKRVPNFSLHIKRYYPSNDRPDRVERKKVVDKLVDYNLQYIDTIIGADDIYRENWDITGIVRNSFREAPGKFVLQDPGHYKLLASGSDNCFEHTIWSNEIWIIIK